MRLRLLNKLILFFLLLNFGSCFAAGSVDLFILAGQSNMQGYTGDARFYPEELSQEDGSIKFYYIEPKLVDHKLVPWLAEKPVSFLSRIKTNIKDFLQWARGPEPWPPAPVLQRQWSHLGPQKGIFPKGHFGPEISFARKLRAEGFTPAIFKYTKESTSLYDDWKQPGENGLYDDFLTSLQLAVTELTQSGYSVNIKGLIWIQGENDAIEEQSANEYQTRLLTIITDLRLKILPQKAPIILGADELHPHMQRHRQVLTAQIALAEADPCIVHSSMVGLAKADFTHLTPQALPEHGLRIYDSYRKVTAECK